MRTKPNQPQERFLSYYDEETGQRVGYISYTLEDKIVLRAEHTVVDEAFRGQGIARLLVETLVVLCRSKGYLVRPICSYVARLFERTAEWSNLLEDYDGSAALLDQLQTQANAEKAQKLQRYFKTAPGEYAEGDIFLGVTVPQMRTLLREAKPITLGTIRALSQSPLHEARWLAFVALVQRANEATSALRRKKLYDLYLSLAERCNNWDLVDSSAPVLAGGHWADLSEQERKAKPLILAKAPHLWTQRIAVIGTLGLIRRGSYTEAIEVCLALRKHPHDLIHKATGWMLREVGKRAPELLREILDAHASELPRTTLRYAIEHMTEQERSHYLTR